LLGKFWLFDCNVKYDLGSAAAGRNRYLAGAYVSAGVVNAFNSLPRYSNLFGGIVGYDPSEYDIRGRFVYINFGVRR
jgi:hypothetical protein